jgi:hypothetical protein
MHAPRILLIAVDGDTHQGLRRRLLRRGCEVFEAGTPREAERMACDLEPDLVVEEHPLASPHRPGAYDEVLSAIELLAGPLPGCPRKPRPGARRRGWAHRRGPAAAAHGRHRHG